MNIHFPSCKITHVFLLINRLWTLFRPL